MRDTSECAVRTEPQQPWFEDGYWVIVNGISEVSRRTSEGCLSFLTQPAGRPRGIEDHVRTINIFMDGWKRRCLEHISNGYKVYLVDGHIPKEARQLALGAIDAAFKWSGPALDAKKADWPRTKDPPTPEDEFVEWIANTGFPRELIRQSFDLPSVRADFESTFQRLLEQAEKEAQRELRVKLGVMDAAREALAAEQEQHAAIRGQVAQTETTRVSKKHGRPPRLRVEFVNLAGTLWLKRDGAEAKIVQLRKIATVLDAESFVPPAEYLEGEWAEKLKTYNTHNSNSTAGPVKTWTQLVTTANKHQLLRGMVKTLSRCAGRVRTAPTELSGK